MKRSKLYRILRPLIVIFVKVFLRPKFIGLKNIPKSNNFILAGNHTSILDPLLLITSTKKSIHFLAKDELWKGPKKIIFNNLGLIPVNRREKDPEAISLAEDYLLHNRVIGIFPEGTTEKGRGLLPFKFGAVKMAKETNCKIIPFAIKGKYRLFSKDLTITFGKPMTISNELLVKANNDLTQTVTELLED